MLQEMEAKPWRDRVRQEDELVEQLKLQISEAAKRRAQALIDGVTELGSIAEVARDLGKSWTAIDKAIKKNGPVERGPKTT
jgi:molybdenum-dependent DNA-binding transcriptional regulator ModE